MGAGSLDGRLALVTGASSGLGVDFARELAARGCDLILVARREELLLAVRDELTAAYGVAVSVVAMDLSENNAPQRLYEQVKTGGRTVDVLVNNAGSGLYGRFLELPWERERAMLELNITALVQMTKLFTADTVAQRFGYVLQVASIGAFFPLPLYASYAAAKSFVLHFGQAINYELRGSGVSCTVLAPGITATEFFQVAGQKMTFYQRLVVMTSSEVAAIGIKAMLRRRASMVPGLLNSVSLALSRLLPGRLVSAIAHLLINSEARS